MFSFNLLFFMNCPILSLDNEYYFKRINKSWLSLWTLKTFPNDNPLYPSLTQNPFLRLRLSHIEKSREWGSSLVFSVGSLNKEEVPLTSCCQGSFPSSKFFLFQPELIHHNPQGWRKKTPWQFGTWYLNQVFPSPFLYQRRPLKASRTTTTHPQQLS